MANAAPISDVSPGLAGATEALRRHWGHATFRPGQEEAVQAVLRGEDVLAVLPTGGGKSVCYQVPAALGKGLTIVVSPLIALMQDQVAGLRARGVSSTFINSQLSYRDIEQRWLDAEYGLYRLLYLAPERLTKEAFHQRADRLDVRLIAIDEAHCISEWGPDFRPAYRRIAEAAEMLGRPPIIALTATATPEVRKDIIEQLDLREPRVVVSGFDRPNVIPTVFRTGAKQEKLEEVLRSVPGTAIVYVATRAMAEVTSQRLRQAGVSAGAYHAGMPASERMIAQERWQSGEMRVIVATNAFGMGIDKPDVRCVLHVDVPFSIEAYYQEAGRAGRDGKTSFAILLFAESDEVAARSFVDEARPSRKSVQTVYDTICSIAQIAIGSAVERPFIVNVEKVSAATGLSGMAVRAALELLTKEGVCDEVRIGRGRVLVRLTDSATAIRHFADKQSNRALAEFIGELLRTVPGEAFHDWAELSVERLARRLDMKEVRIYRGLDFLEQRGFLRYLPPSDGVWLRLTGHRSKSVPIDGAALQRNRARAERRLDVMLRYVQGVGCRRHFLLSYFGEKAPTRCGSCDICLGRHRPRTITPDDEPVLQKILQSVRHGEAATEWGKDIDLPGHRILGLADWLVNEGYMRLADPLEVSYELTKKGEEAAAQEPRAS